ncbi:LCP family protein [Ureibacillus sinduriensis]|uniref:Regulatory protein MsrR n=1 Tax=Ureibacillus sinduriensis BLB-1 = JCM 15800 TaxID=1384057 RepID=A0A0A3I2Q7_9BACL|nr:LCP family protein [Ureibacillus sinduriensis]KGR76933.1 transcriptional regulator [Ureibacillus sinduriensis BLB-1 = JCM 15800]
MEEQPLEEKRQTRRKKRKLRKGRLFFTLLILLLIGIGIFSYFQYRSGLNLASKTKLPEAEFVADKSDGKIKNYLIIGVDSRGEEESRSDTMMLLSWNQDTNDLKLVSFMRDIYADIPGYKSYKLNTAYYLGGVQLLKETLNSMFEVPIHHYALIDFKSFESLIDILAPNGIEMDVEKDMSAFIGVTLSKGQQRLNGQELLGYARFRHDAEGDFGRVERQQKVIDALKDELLSPSNMDNLPKFIGAAQGYITTDLTTSEEIKSVLSLALGGKVEIEKLTIPVEGSYDYQSYSHAGEVIEIDVDANRQYLHDFLQLK